ncbi:MAG: CoA transferase [Chloroflexi bacterium]|nr:CoA transferase [Chloroflexota bacterium]MBL7061306.1 CoA transferase [Dehalococcoidia bacterium]
MLALEGIKVLDLTHLAPGGLCTMILGDLGADVIKVEALPGVGGRGAVIGLSPMGEEGRREAAFDALSRNKRSIGLNLKSDKGRDIFYQLAQTADVVVEGFRPGVVKRLGVDYEKIRSINPGIIYCSLSGYGQDGPYSNRSGHDVNYISMAGALSLIGSTDRPPVVPLNLLADFAGASLHGVMGILAALVARGKTGRGQHVDIAYTDGVITLLSWFVSNYFSRGIMFNRGETWLHGAYPYYGVYEAKDGKYVSIGCLEPWFWENLCRALGKEEYISYCISPEHFLHKPEGEKWEEISSCLKQVFLTRTRDEWFDFLIDKDVPVGKVYTFDEVFNDPQVLHRQMVLEIDHPTLGKVKHPGIAIKLSETPGKVRSLAPIFGEHTDEILRELSYSKSQIEELRQSDIIG